MLIGFDRPRPTSPRSTARLNTLNWVLSNFRPIILVVVVIFPTSAAH
jgi:hypothetical protein